MLHVQLMSNEYTLDENAIGFDGKTLTRRYLTMIWLCEQYHVFVFSI